MFCALSRMFTVGSGLLCSYLVWRFGGYAHSELRRNVASGLGPALGGLALPAETEREDRYHQIADTDILDVVSQS